LDKPYVSFWARCDFTHAASVDRLDRELFDASWSRRMRSIDWHQQGIDDEHA
jgi:hypothetical protein